MLIRATVTIALGLTLTSTFVSAQERAPYGVRTLSIQHRRSPAAARRRWHRRNDTMPEGMTLRRI